MKRTERKLIRNVGPDDVLLGRGAGPNEHLGNITFRQIIAEHKKSYIATTNRKIKHLIAEKAVRTVKANGGRFLQRVKGEAEDVFEAADESAVIEKAKQALRHVEKPSRRRKNVSLPARAGQHPLNQIQEMGVPPTQINNRTPLTSGAAQLEDLILKSAEAAAALSVQVSALASSNSSNPLHPPATNNTTVLLFQAQQRALVNLQNVNNQQQETTSGPNASSAVGPSDSVSALLWKHNLQNLVSQSSDGSVSESLARELLKDAIIQQRVALPSRRRTATQQDGPIHHISSLLNESNLMSAMASPPVASPAPSPVNSRQVLANSIASLTVLNAFNQPPTPSPAPSSSSSSSIGQELHRHQSASDAANLIQQAQTLEIVKRFLSSR